MSKHCLKSLKFMGNPETYSERQTSKMKRFVKVVKG